MAMDRKIELTESDLKKIILILKSSKPFLQIPTNNIAVYNMWRQSEKFADKLIKKGGFITYMYKGRLVVKSSEGVEKPSASLEEGLIKVPRYRKRKKI